LSKLIGLSGYARSGKDSIANILAEHGYQRVAFADKLKEATRRLNPIVAVMPFDQAQADGWELKAYIEHPPYLRVQDIEELHTPDEIKELYPEKRTLDQRMGTEVGRDLFDQNFWVDIAFSGLDLNSKYVFTDARFPNEFDGIKAHGGQVWRVNRPGYGPANSHPSEISLDHHEFDAVFTNDSSLDELRHTVLNYINEEDTGRGGTTFLHGYDEMAHILVPGVHAG
jgi:hypothetical protein